LISDSAARRPRRERPLRLRLAEKASWAESAIV
jgi:hypothetical protein